MRFARNVFLVAGIYGLAVLLPQFFLEWKVNADFPPAITHPENFYGFVALASVFQVVFLIISSDPARFRPIMLAAVAEKFSYAIAVFVLFAQGRLPAVLTAFGAIDSVLGVLFLLSFYLTRGPEPARG